MKIFINGGAGFIGSHLINEIQSRGFEIISTKRSTSRSRSPLKKEPEWISSKDLNGITSAMKKCSSFINCGALGVSPQNATWTDLIEYNINQTFSLLTMAKKSGIKDYIFLGSQMEISLEDIYSYEKNQNLNPYAICKTTAAYLFCSYAKLNNLNMKYIKIPNVYGDGQFSENLWPSLRQAALAGEDFNIKNKDTNKSFISVKKVSQIIADSLEPNSKKNNKLNIIDVEGKNMNVLEFAELHWKKWKASGKLL